MSGIVFVGYGAESRRAIRLRVAKSPRRKIDLKPYEDRECIVCGITFQTNRKDAQHCHNKCSVITYRKKIQRSKWLKDDALILLVNRLSPNVVIDGVKLARMERNSSKLAMIDFIKLLENKINRSDLQSVSINVKK